MATLFYCGKGSTGFIVAFDGTSDQVDASWIGQGCYKFVTLIRSRVQ